MPLAINPKAIFTVVLESDKEIEPEKQPKFFYRYLTGLQQLELTRMMDELEELKEGSEALEEVFRAAVIGLVGWTNIRDENGGEVTFDSNDLKKIMGMNEAMELAKKVFSQGLTFDELKNSGSPSESSTAADAETAKE